MRTTDQEGDRSTEPAGPTLIEPHGGTLQNLIAEKGRSNELRTEAKGLPDWTLTPRQLCDLELLLNGAFSPLDGFLARTDYESVLANMRLADGTLWPIPINLDVTPQRADALDAGRTILALRDPEGVMLAALHVEEIWEPDLEVEARRVYGTTDPNHPGVRYLLEQQNRVYVGGRVEGVQDPLHHDFKELRITPAELRREFQRSGWRKVVAFQTRNPMHRAHQELTRRAAADAGANLLIHPVVGLTRPGDIDHFTRVRCYQAVLHHYPKFTAKLALLNLAMRMGGPREALWHAIIRKNHGCTHFIVGRDHAGPGSDENGEAFYRPYEAQEALRAHQEETGVTMVPFSMVAYVPERSTYLPVGEVPAGTRTETLSGTELRKRLQDGLEIPDWFTYPEVVAELRRTHPPRNRQGFTVFFTGLSGSGKSTLANVLRVKLLELGGRPVTLLDGDLVRKTLSSELGFSKADRDTNIRRIGWVAREITQGGGIAICAPIAPYDRVRKELRRQIDPVGGFLLVQVNTPLEVCEARDRKGLYAKARAGLIDEFTGISDPYEEPRDAELVIDTTEITPYEGAQQIFLFLEKEGYIGADLD